jgi:hypothetical protein
MYDVMMISNTTNTTNITNKYQYYKLISNVKFQILQKSPQSVSRTAKQSSKD